MDNKKSNQNINLNIYNSLTKNDVITKYTSKEDLEIFLDNISPILKTILGAAKESCKRVKE